MIQWEDLGNFYVFLLARHTKHNLQISRILTTDLIGVSQCLKRPEWTLGVLAPPRSVHQEEQQESKTNIIRRMFREIIACLGRARVLDPMCHMCPARAGTLIPSRSISQYVNLANNRGPRYYWQLSLARWTHRMDNLIFSISSLELYLRCSRNVPGRFVARKDQLVLIPGKDYIVMGLCRNFCVGRT